MAVVSEHEQVPTKQDIPANQTPEDKSIIRKVQEMLTRAKRYRKRYDSEWKSNYEFVCSGRQWPLDRARWRFSEVVNMTWASIMTEIAIQTDSRPKFEYSYQETSDEAFSKALSDVNGRNWDKFKWSSVITDMLFDCKIYHVAHSIVEWDPDVEYGVGDVSFRALDPYYCYWDPKASDVNRGRKARYFIYAEPVPTSELRLKHQDLKDKILADVNEFQKGDVAGTQSRIQTTYDPYSPSRLPSSSTQSGEMYGGEPHTQLIRCWMRDDTMEELCEETQDKELGEIKKEYILKQKYPKGRYIEIANNVLLRDSAPGVEIDGEWVEYEDDCFPIARCVNYQYPREYAGENEVTHTKGPQKIQNYIWSYMLDMFKIQANPITVVGDASNVDDEQITNEPGNIIHAADINQVRREPGTPITAGSFDLLNQSKSYFDMIQGLQDVSKGAEMSNATSAIMLEGYMEAAQTRPRMKNRNLDQFLQDTGELVLKRMLQFYTQPRVFRVTNKEGYPENIEFSIPVTEGGQKVAKIKRFVTNPNGSQTDLQNSQVEVKGVPDVRVLSGSQLPFAKAQRNQQALSYFSAGSIDNEELLKTVDWPNYESVIKRLDEKAAAAQQQEALKQGA